MRKTTSMARQSVVTRASWVRGIVCFGAIALLGCSGDAAFAPPFDPETLYWNLRLDHHAVQLTLDEPHNTVQLTASSLTPSDALWNPVGTPEEIATINEQTKPIWWSTDSSKVRVSTAGLVTARALTTSAVRVIVKRQIGNVTRVDTTQVRVVSEPTPKTFALLKVRPVAPDSAKVASLSARSFPAVALDINNDPLPGVVTYYTTQDTTVAKFGNRWLGTVTGLRVGTTKVTATSWVYGVVKTDTFTIQVGYPITSAPVLNKRQRADLSWEFFYSIPSTEVGPGAIVTFANNTGGIGQPGVTASFVFEDSLAVLPSTNVGQNTGGGNINMLTSDTTVTYAMRSRQRRFLTPGRYQYRILPLGIDAVIVVKPQ